RRAVGGGGGARGASIAAAGPAAERGATSRLADALAAASVEETDTVDWALVGLLEEAVGLVGSRDGSRRRAILLAQLARSLYFADAARRHAYSEEAVRLARPAPARLALRAPPPPRAPPLSV